MPSRTPMAVVVTVVLTACGAGSGPTPAAPDLERLCQAADAPTAEEIEVLFSGPTHQALHDLADELQEADLRPVAGDVLETKQAVESALAEGATPAQLHTRLDRLIAAVGRAAGVLGQQPLTCAD